MENNITKEVLNRLEKLLDGAIEKDNISNNEENQLALLNKIKNYKEIIKHIKENVHKELNKEQVDFDELINLTKDYIKLNENIEILRNYKAFFNQYIINMKFIITKASNFSYKETIEINSIEELLTFKNNCNHPIIIDTDENGNGTIEIYDDYIE